MDLKAVLFDLDGTLLPMDQDLFMKYYFGELAKKMAPLGYDPKKLIDDVWTGTKAMVMNDGSQTNADAFWNKFAELVGKDCRKDEPVFDSFYRNEFCKAKAACQPTPATKELIDYLKGCGRRVILATNPLFPSVATENRIQWAGLSTDDFELITTYENSHYCKPNPKYYQEILENIGCAPEECLMVGNNAEEDMIAETLEMKVFLLTDCLINEKNADISGYPQGGFKKLKQYIDTLLQ
ncbi:MAG: HAD family hydrolase [Lachnospiraceae bacterium]|nr:HAD family hydrolase [Lachnospiraceae bacterium]